MDWLNYHHLLYFWMVAREGGITRACERLGLAQPTISGQLRKLEHHVGERLFHQSGKTLVLTEMGKVVFSYADEIFKLGQELQIAIKGRLPGRPLRLVVGVADVLPKLIVHRFLVAAHSLPDPVCIVCREGKPERLLGDLAVHDLDVVLSDALPGPLVKVKVHSHLLGRCGLTFFGTAELAAHYREGFPESLHHAPMLLPTEETATRRQLEPWLRNQRLVPEMRGEFDDSALMKIFGQHGEGIFPGPSVIEEEVCRQHQVEVVGRVNDIELRYYAITAERRLRHPAVAALYTAARADLFHQPGEGEDDEPER